MRSTGELLFQTITINAGKGLYITNIYKRYDMNLSLTMVGDIPYTENAHNIILGDFNSHNVLCPLLTPPVAEYGNILLTTRT